MSTVAPRHLATGEQRGGSHSYVLQQPGHVNGLVNLNDQLVNEYRYMPFGSPVSGFPVQGTPNPLQYMARELDAATGMYYVHNRWYDPQQGRFVSEDPIGLAGGINPYAYVGDNPIAFRDPMGLSPCMMWLIASYMSTIHIATYWECEASVSGMSFDGSIPGVPTIRTDPSSRNGGSNSRPANPSGGPGTSRPTCNSGPVAFGFQKFGGGEVGLGVVGVSSQMAAGAIHYGGGNNGAYTTYGYFAGALGYGEDTMGHTRSGFVLGASAGTGVQWVVTNAKTNADMLGSFHTFTFNGWGTTVSLSLDSDTWAVAAGGGPGYRYSASHYRTNTLALAASKCRR